MAKCRICKLNIKTKTDDFIRPKHGVYYHTDCYTERELEKDIPLELIEEVIENAKKEFEQDKEKKVKKYKSENIREGIKELTKWIQSEYDIGFLPKMFHVKIASVANGTHKGLKEPVSYIDLLDMLQRRKKQLDLRLVSKKFDTTLHRFYYDLAVVLNQYDSYKNWKIVQENKKLEAIESLELQKRVRQGELSGLKTNKKTKDEDSIENIINDIFG